MQTLGEAGGITPASNRNSFGAVKWRNTGEEAALNAGVVRQLDLCTKVQEENYAPFTRFFLTNNSAETIAVYIDGQADSTTGVVAGYKDVHYIEPKNGLDIRPYDNGEPDLVFTTITIKNTTTGNTATNEIAWRVANY